MTGAEDTGDTSAFVCSVGERERVRQVQELLKVLEEQVKGLLRVVELFEARKPKGRRSSPISMATSPILRRTACAR